MNDTSTFGPQAGRSRIKLFLALSRTPHGLLDMATPALGALLWLGAFPPLRVILIGLLTAFAGYTAVYALNDMIDYRVDKESVQLKNRSESENYLDDVLVRHPMAYGLLSLKEGVYWTAAWSLLAVVGAFMLNPLCVVIFICGCVLEIIYCLLLRITHLRTFVSGGVKTTGAIAAVFAVDPTPSPYFLILLFLWLFFWEVGGQNIPHDWADIQEDRRLNTETIPVRFGPNGATLMILISLLIAFSFSVINFYFSQADYRFPFVLAAAGAGLFLLIIPAVQLYRKKKRRYAMMLFNKASYYPLVILVVVVINLIYRS